MLQVPDFEKKFVLVTNANDYAISAVLNQRVGQHLAPFPISRLLRAAERNYYTCEKVSGSVVWL